MATTERFVAFRAFGNFSWPPVPGAPITKWVQGCVEVHFLLVPGKHNYIACIRWLPASLPVNGGTLSVKAPTDEDWPGFDYPLSSLQQVEALTLAQLSEALADSDDKEVAYRCDAGPSSGPAKRLVFSGISVLEQYAVPALGVDIKRTECTARLPLLHTYCHGDDPATAQQHSSLQIGLDKNAGIRLNLSMSLAAPQNDVQHVQKTAMFAFSALYSASFASNELDGEALSFNTLTFGPNAHDSNLYEIKPGRIGEFGFFKYGKQAAGVAVCSVASQWPTEQSVLEGTMQQLGYRYVPKQQYKKEIDSFAKLHKDIAPDLIRMPSVVLQSRLKDGDTDSFRLRQTFAIQSGSAWAQAIHESQSDIRVVRATSSRPIHFQLRAPEGGDHWIDLAETVYLVLDIDGAVAPSAVWETRHLVTLSARIGWSEPAELLESPADPFQAAPSFHAGANAGQLLNAAISSMRLARADLRHLSPDQPQCMLPDLVPSASPGSANLHYGLFTSFGNLTLDHLAGLDRAPFADKDELRASYRLSFQTTDVVTKSPRMTRLAMQAVWPSFFLQSQRADMADLSFVHAKEVLAPRERGPRTAGTRFVVFCLLDETSEARPPLTGALGGLLFLHSLRASGKNDFALLKTEDQTRSVLRFAPRQAIVLGARRDRLLAAGNLELRLRFKIDAVAPIAVDVPHGDRSERKQPLLLRETPPSADETRARYYLDIHETLDDNAGRRLTAVVSESDRNPPAIIKTIMVSAEPFSVQRLLSSSLNSLGNPADTTVAKYDSDTRVWELQRDDRDYHYVLAPQVAGESMDKPRRLEIHDAAADDTPLDQLPEFLNQGFLSPVVPDGGSLQRRAVEFRLSPPAELWIAPSDVRRNYFAPQWASHEIFRQKSELGLGAALVALRAEFLYGMPVSVSSRAELGLSRRARVAELEALTGRPLGAMTSPDSPISARWESLRRVLASRPERLEIWADDPDSAVQFAPARFSDGARFSLRTTALHRPPVPDAETGEKWPVQLSPNAPRMHPFGLSGGALWPVESNNVLGMILREPACNNGTIERIALSPHGGDADQNAKFCGGRVALISSTRAGFVQRQKVEVIGRIGVFWHRAKHVVVYERTVNPSAQFTPEGGLGTRTRRPVLRKISEYIEILEPERRYPDLQTKSTIPSGFLRGVRFNKRIIPVDSAWAEDVGTNGWQIPLWNRHAARVRPQVYARPDVAFVTAAEGPEVDAETAQECLDPENLYFFADTSQGKTDQTDAWPARRYVDYTELPPPTPAKDVTAASSRVPPRVPPGYSRFTWSLAPSSQRTAINAGRASTYVYAALDTLTFMRASPTVQPDVAKNGKALLEKVTETDFSQVAPILPGLWNHKSELRGMKEEPIGKFAAALASTLTEMPAALPADPDEVARLRARFESMLAQVAALEQDTSTGKLAAKVAETSAGLTGKFKGLPDIEAFEQQLNGSCKKLRTNLGQAVNAKRLSMTQELQAWHARIQFALDGDLTELKGKFVDPETLRTFLKKEMSAFLLPVFVDNVPEFGKLRRGIETARVAMADARGQIEEQLRAAHAQLQALRDATDMTKPWSEARLQQFEARLNELFERTNGRAVTIVHDGKIRIATQLDELSQSVGNAAAHALGTLDALIPRRDPLAEQLAQFRATIDAHQAKSMQLFDALRAALKDAVKSDAKLKPKIDAIQATADKLENMLKQADQHVQMLEASLANAGSVLSTTAMNALDVLKQLVGVAGSTLQTTLDSLAAELDTLEKPLLEAIRVSLSSVRLTVDQALAPVLTSLSGTVNWVQALLDDSAKNLALALKHLDSHFHDAAETIELVVQASLKKVEQIEAELAPDNLVNLITESVLNNPTIVAAIAQAVSGANAAGAAAERWRANAKIELQRLVVQLADMLGAGFELVGAPLDTLNETCVQLGGGLREIREAITASAETLLGPMRATLCNYATLLNDQLNDALADAEKYRKLAETFSNFDRDIRVNGNELASRMQQAQAYGERVIDAIGRIATGGLEAAPGNVLRALAAAGDAPLMPNLDYAKEKLNYYYQALADVVDMTPVEAYFGRLGEGLSAMGISVPCKQIGNWLKTMDLSNFDIGKLLKKFAGIDLAWLMNGKKFPKGLSDAIKITHDYDKAKQRAWIQIDVHVPLDGRTALFSVGPFTLDVVSAVLTGQVRLEASAASEKLEQTGSAMVAANLDALVGGQSMVQLKEVKIHYSKGGGLEVEFDPTNIQLNPTFQNIQNVLGSIFGDEIGGLKVIKQDGMPVGVEHIFSMPPMSLMFGTSGVQNIQICNQFQLRAYPDFVIANRFSLAKPDCPFIFSVFIIGGTGWLTVDVEYRPFKDELMVLVEAGAGGSASLGFAFAGCTGSVFITISMALTYRKLIGRPGGGLTVSLVVLIVGMVDVLCIANACISVMLRLSYMPNGDIDATGTFRLTIRISRFFTVSAGGQARYHMTGGQSQSSSSSEVGYEVTEPNFKKAEKLIKGQKGR